MKEELKFDEVIGKILGGLPSDLGAMREDVEKNLKAALQSAFARMDLVTREEFDAQSELLARTRALLDELEKKIQALEQSQRIGQTSEETSGETKK